MTDQHSENVLMKLSGPQSIDVSIRTGEVLIDGRPATLPERLAVYLLLLVISPVLIGVGLVIACVAGIVWIASAVICLAAMVADRIWER